MESGKVLAVNSMARIEHVEIDSSDLNQGFEKFAEHLKQNALFWPQLLASAFSAGKTSMIVACDSSGSTLCCAHWNEARICANSERLQAR